jgi:hypothetical protein
MLAVVAPLLHKYVEAPLAVSVADSPAQIVDAEALKVTDGRAFTVMVFEITTEQPELLVPVTL